MKSHCYSSHGIPITKRILLAWAAGFFDGEGYVGVRSNGKSGKFLAASVAQKDRRLLKRFQLIVERGNIGKPAKSSGVSYLTFTNSPDVRTRKDKRVTISKYTSLQNLRILGRRRLQRSWKRQAMSSPTSGGNVRVSHGNRLSLISRASSLLRHLC